MSICWKWDCGAPVPHEHGEPRSPINEDQPATGAGPSAGPNPYPCVHQPKCIPSHHCTLQSKCWSEGYAAGRRAALEEAARAIVTLRLFDGRPSPEVGRVWADVYEAIEKLKGGVGDGK